MKTKLTLIVFLISLTNITYSNSSLGENLSPIHFRGNVESKISRNLDYDLSIYFNSHTNPEVTFFLRIYNDKGLHIDELEFNIENWENYIILELLNDKGEVQQDRVIKIFEFETKGIKYKDHLENSDPNIDLKTMKETFFEDITESYYVGSFGTMKPQNHIQYKNVLRKNIKECRVKFVDGESYDKVLEDLINSILENNVDEY